MTKNRFRRELKSLIFALGPLARSLGNPVVSNILDDFGLTLRYSRLRERRRFLIWGLLIGRSVDSFTSFFLSEKNETITNCYRNTFNNRINKICRTTNPLTRNPTIKNDLRDVKDLRNELFHNAGRHFTEGEMRTFVYDSVKCVLQLIGDL